MTICPYIRQFLDGIDDLIWERPEGIIPHHLLVDLPNDYTLSLYAEIVVDGDIPYVESCLIRNAEITLYDENDTILPTSLTNREFFSIIEKHIEDTLPEINHEIANEVSYEEVRCNIMLGRL